MFKNILNRKNKKESSNANKLPIEARHSIPEDIDEIPPYRISPYQTISYKHVKFEDIQSKAYQIWIDSGQLNGEDLIDTEFGFIKRSDYYWKLAENQIKEQIISFLQEEIIEISREILDVKNLDIYQNFDEIKIDSIYFIEFIFLVEEKYSIRIEGDDIEKINNLSDIIDFIERSI